MPWSIAQPITTYVPQTITPDIQSATWRTRSLIALLWQANTAMQAPVGYGTSYLLIFGRSLLLWYCWILQRLFYHSTICEASDPITHSFHIIMELSPGRDSNSRPSGYEASVPTTRLPSSHFLFCCNNRCCSCCCCCRYHTPRVLPR